MILIFDTEKQAQKALDRINSNIGCFYSDNSGYFMKSWADIKQGGGKWYFPKPIAILRKTVNEIMEGVVAEELEAVPKYHITLQKHK